MLKKPTIADSTDVLRPHAQLGSRSPRLPRGQFRSRYSRDPMAAGRRVAGADGVSASHHTVAVPHHPKNIGGIGISHRRMSGVVPQRLLPSPKAAGIGTGVPCWRTHSGTDQMPRILERALSPAFVNSVTEPGLYADGGCLYLQVTEGKHYDKALLKWVKNGRINKSWVFKFRAGKRERNMGLGAVRTVGLSEARAKARKLRQDRLDGIDPLEERNRARAAVAVAAAKTTTFDECAQAYMKAQEAGWRNAKHASQWRNTLSSYVSPVFGALPVRDIDTALVLKALEPIWTTKPETASRVRGRIELVLDWAKARGYREGGNPAQWKGHLKNLLPATRKVAKVKHLAAMPYLELPSFMAALRAQEGLAARALEFAVLTATRSGEVLGAVWDE